MHKKNFWKSCNNKKLEKMLSETKDIAQFKNIQTVYLKSCFSLDAGSIANITGFSKRYVWNIHYFYRKDGDKIFNLGKKGGIYRRNLSEVQEKELLSEFIDRSDSGKILEIGSIKKRYQELAGKEVHKSVVYRMLAKYGWRKIAPRPYHPKNDKKAMEDFKKNFR